jgi:hypothetical protein
VHADLFINSNNVGSSSSFMTWDQLSGLSADGNEIGGQHARSRRPDHRQLDRGDASGLRRPAGADLARLSTSPTSTIRTARKHLSRIDRQWLRVQLGSTRLGALSSWAGRSELPRRRRWSAAVHDPPPAVVQPVEDPDYRGSRFTHLGRPRAGGHTG